MRGTRGTSTMPAPSRPRRLDFDDERPVRTERELLRLLRALPDTTSTVAGAVPHTSQ
ncbi:hypothetical protein GCM10009764_65850 [Nocardia ninae]|uniref:Uncharacterized protein n=1 Tax=Nocardia ninae NBRC 108245 TaxID=1210091 RepID=A0A511M6V8_9NOCA|nr:hypothetical protein NN4_08920 [Nocardia ninae NBRC 108245]